MRASATLTLVLACCHVGVLADEPAELVLRGGRVVTLSKRPAEAEALAASGGRIVAVGSDQEVSRRIGPDTRVIELAGRLVVPGFIEGHGHLMSLGRRKMQLDVFGVKNWAEIVRRVEAAVATTPRGRWIIGGGWHQEHWDTRPRPHVDGYPVHDLLSRVSPHHPVVLTHRTGHMLLANARAMELAGINDDTPDPRGGRVLRDAGGRAIGVFRETAQALIRRAQQQSTADLSVDQVETDALKAIELATKECLQHGITSFQDAGASFRDVDRFKRLANTNRLKIRLWVMLREPNSRLALRLQDYRMIDEGGGFLTVRAIKQMVDGALGSHGAWLLEPYDDMPESRGLVVTPMETIRETALLAVRQNMQLCVHAIGDRANREILNLYRVIFHSFPKRRDWRWRIEHAQHVHPTDIPRFGELGVIASMQANHCTSDGPFVVARLGERRARSGAYAWRRLISKGALIVNGTDAPVEKIDPILCFHAAVTRRMANGKVFFEKQKMTRRQALESYTHNAAYAAFEEDQKGSLVPGKLADLVVLSHDILKVPESEILKAKVDYTIVGGRVVYRCRQ